MESNRKKGSSRVVFNTKRKKKYVYRTSSSPVGKAKTPKKIHLMDTFGDESSDGEEDTIGKFIDTQENVNTDDEDQKYFKHALPKPPCFFAVNRTDWRKLRQQQNYDRFPGIEWTNVISAGLRSIHPHCIFAFLGHRVQVRGSSRRGFIFKCSAFCTVNDCPVDVDVIVENEQYLEAQVFFKGEMAVHCKSELQRRPVKADLQRKLYKKLETMPPRSVCLKDMDRLEELVFESMWRNRAISMSVPQKSVVSKNQRSVKREHEMLSVHRMYVDQTEEPDDVLKIVSVLPKGVALWSQKSIGIFHQRSKEDIVYATGYVVEKSKENPTPFYAYELVVRNPEKYLSLFPVATYVTDDDTMPSVYYFLGSFQNDHTILYGCENVTPLMIVCDGSMALMQVISLAFCENSLNFLLNSYFHILTGKGTEGDFRQPILHRGLRHTMEKAISLCKKHASTNYRLTMHIFGVLTTARSLPDFDRMLRSCAVMFLSPCFGKNVGKHLSKLRRMKTTFTFDSDEDESRTDPDDFEDVPDPKPFRRYFKKVIRSAHLDTKGDPNWMYSKAFMTQLAAHFLPYAPLWTNMMLGDLGRHGEGPLYQEFSKKFSETSKIKRQNFTQESNGQEIMEKSEWHLKNIRYKGQQLKRLDDFVAVYKNTHLELLREFSDTQCMTESKAMDEDKPWALYSEEGEHGYIREAIDIMKQHFQIVNHKEFLQNPSLLGSKIQALFLWNTIPTVEPSLLSSLSTLKVIANGGVGIDHLDVPYINSLGVRVTNTPHVVSDATADIALGLLLASARRIVEGHQMSVDPKTTHFPQTFMGFEVTGSTLGIIGMGHIGYKIAQRGRGFDMKILYHNRSRRSAEDEQAVGATYCQRMDDLLRQSDFVVLAVNLTPETTALISHKELSLMKPTGTLVNISRGRVVDQDALVLALQLGTIRAAALDVTYPEPLPRDHPLLHLPNVLITPHAGTNTYTTTKKMVQMMVDSAVAVVKGLPIPNEVKPL